MDTEKTKEYRNSDITVIWKPGLCTHSTNCWRQLGNVFDPRKRPWVNLDGDTSEIIAAQVERCPSGALTWRRNPAQEPGARAD